MELRDSVTRENLLRAFAGESQARNRYTFAASAAKKAGLQVIEGLFTYTAGQEKEHAQVFYNFLKQGGCREVEITAGYPVDCSDDPAQLLRLAHDHEYEEYREIYPAFADKAEEEGFAEIARRFRLIAQIEKLHGDRFQRFGRLLEEGRLFASEARTGWFGLNCDHFFEGTQAPEKCPACDHGRGYFIRLELSPYEK